jgi:ribosome biogenesis protein BMS1
LPLIPSPQIKFYSKQNISAVKGPITLVSGKARRLTFIEAPATDIAAQIDLAKVADLALIMMDASYGFEMETFEFINIMQNHGMPKILGVLTHLDKFPETKTIRSKKKEFKKRFWAEIYDGAKLFYFSGLQYGRYPQTEVVNLSRYGLSIIILLFCGIS